MTEEVLNLLNLAAGVVTQAGAGSAKVMEALHPANPNGGKRSSRLTRSLSD